jgi:Flp pilus assembly protein TadD
MTSTHAVPEHLAGPPEPQAVLPSMWSFPTPFQSAATGDGSMSGPLVRARIAADRDPDNPIAWARRAQIAQGLGLKPEASDAARRALALSVDHMNAASALAAVVVLAANGCNAALGEMLSDRRAEQLPANILMRAAISMGRNDLALDFSEGATSADVLALRTWLHLRRQEFSEAIAAARAAGAAGAWEPSLLANMGYAYSALGQLQRAIKATRQAAALAPADRVIAFNLASFYRFNGQETAAIAVLENMRQGAWDAELALTLADARVGAGDVDGARRLLQQVRTSSAWASTNPERQAELEANLALLRWMTHREEGDRTANAVLRAFTESGSRSLEIASLLFPLLRSRSDVGRLTRVIDSLAQHHSADSLYGLRTHRAVLAREADEAVRWAELWAEADWLNPTASGAAVHLLVDLAGRVQDAAALGRAALRRFPHDRLLANNTAYAAALAGKPDEAKQLLLPWRDSLEDDVVMSATWALTEVLSGDLVHGCERYQRARELADRRGDGALAYLVSLNAALAARMQAPADDYATVEPLPSHLSERIDFWITGHRFERETGSALFYTAK